MEQNLKLDKNDGGPRVDASQYQRLVGRVLYLKATRTDIAFSVNVLSKFVVDPRESYLEAANRVLRYLKNTQGQGILLPKEGGTNLVVYCDSDWLGFPFTRRSRTEYRSMESTVSEIVWMRWLLCELVVSQKGPTVLFCDNQATRHIANNLAFHERTKHVEMDCYFGRERVEAVIIQPLNIDTKSQIADLLTKALGGRQLRFILDKLGVRNLHTPT
ncbi:putative mitochondrial protein AtMg00240 [Bidens hawaiensis]|uniref:putative mitochondrial protein AtMg00240 n=1 Tax=Bidens hawaiensis TaxID=980011 RepID=UPI00404AA960